MPGSRITGRVVTCALGRPVGLRALADQRYEAVTRADLLDPAAQTILILGGSQGAQAIILGCTEISLLVGPDDAPVPLFDTTAIHAGHAVDWALGRA